ncbi:hypothetical protein YOLOSWAG_159 [Erwinia phage vB_EamM_Yoloswag]|uniref:Uncharacterized protein n=1 Tax=Erwinia phage vB_EamM_Yoloswag TaxID=1958956 RepID=A0A1S6L3A6_9CAUD|nr:hypothetical protein HOR66_gp159 [Erwinia phage vB_EamM_Yoloswag]AQT28639.1 hypothetical protein YOLOSWAG_159 [Erwinia phage vB_EamM_Yoloswag]
MLLNELNQLLKKHSNVLGLPSFRAEVSTSGNNLAWLKKTMPRNTACPERLKELVQKSIQELTRP